MKKIVLLVTAIAALFAVSSCQKEIGPVAPGNGNVTFTLQTPQDPATRAIGDGENVNIVYYEIYKAVTGHLNSLDGGEPLVEGTVTMSGKTATLHLNLLEDQNYVALFWAQVDGKNYYDVTDLRNVEVNYAGVKSNDEARAAFCQRLAFNTTENVSEEVILTRPFAQLNIGTTFESLDMDYLIDVTASKVTVTAPARFFNVNTGMAHTTTAEAVEFALATNPQETLYVSDAELKHGYEYVAMNYFLVDGNSSSVDVVFDIETDKGTVTDKVVAQVPVKKNYRTNILGNLLTKETKIEIVVDNDFNTPSHNIFMPLREGGVLKLKDDLYLHEDCPMIVTAGPDRPVTIDLNGYDIYCDETVYVQGKVSALISVQNGSVLTIKGEGTVESTSKEDYAVEVRGGTLNIESGNYVGAYTAAYAIDGVINISGGRFSDLLGDNRYVLNLLGESGSAAEINVTGGTFVGFDPADNVAENPKVNFVEDDYKSVDNGDGTYTVKHIGYIFENNTYYVYTAEGLAKWAYVVNKIDNTVGLTLMNNIELPAVVIEEDPANETYKFSGADIDVVEGVPSGSNWVPVGYSGHYCLSLIDGSDYTISGLRINASKKYAGFIGIAETGSSQEDSEPETVVIKNLKFDDAVVYSSAVAVGVVAGFLQNVTGISNCHVSESTISGGDHTGGIIGYAYTRESDIMVAISDCTVDDKTTVKGMKYVGGIIGHSYGSMVFHCDNAAEVIGSEAVGGIAGHLRDYQPGRSGYIIACTNSGNLSNSGNRTGGIVGYNLYDINHATSESCIVACSSCSNNIIGSLRVGLLVGEAHSNSATIINEYHYGSWALTTDSITSLGYKAGFNACYAYNSAADITPYDIDLMNQSIADYNSRRYTTAQSYCPYTWSWTAGSRPVLVK